MSKKKPQDQKQEQLRDINIGLAFLDTTWRVAIPLLSIMLGAYWLDNQLDSRPVLTLISIPVSMLVSATLVYTQFRRQGLLDDIYGGKKK